VATRITGEAHSARDVTQHVFVTLAQNAESLARHPILPGWLHTTTRNLATKAVRAAVSRQHHEQDAVVLNGLLSSAPDTLWMEIAPHLEAALGQLKESDRNAVLLRYFEKKSATDIAKSLGVSEEAAQRRVNRAIEKLRDIFSRQKITVGSGGLTVLMTAHAVQTAPGGLAAAVSAAALSGSAATKTVALSLVQKSLVTVVLAALGGSGLYQARQVAQLRDQVRILEQQRAQLQDQLRSLEQLQGPLAEKVQQLQQILGDGTGSATLPGTKTRTESEPSKSDPDLSNPPKLPQ
jgi:RNA polymerase sigma factor (sigma-70 family)